MRAAARFWAWLALAGLAGAPPAPAQAPARIAGRVTEAGTGLPVGQAEVTLGGLHAVTAEDGGFVFGSVTPGRHPLRIRRIGFQPLALDVEADPGLERFVAVTLVPAPVELDSVTVLADRAAAPAISGEELVRRGPDLGRALDGWEGVAVRRTGSGGPAAPQLRGGGPDEVLVLVDGVAVNDPLTGRADLSRISSREVERVTLVPGAQTARSGARAIAGVLAIETRTRVRPEASSWIASHGARGFRAAGSWSGLVVSGSGERYASGFPYTVPEVRGGGEARRANAGGRQYAAAIRFRGPVDLSLRGTLADRGLPGPVTNPTPTASASDRALSLSARVDGRVRATALLQWLETRAVDSAPPSGAPYDAYTRGLGGRVELGYREQRGRGAWQGEFGVAAELRADRFGGDGIRPGASFTHGALRLDARLGRGGAASWVVAPVLRLDLWSGERAPRVSGRVDVTRQRGPTALTLAAGSGVTPPVLADLVFREGVGVRLNPDLRPERVRWELEGGIRHEFDGLGGRRGLLSLRGFHGRVADMVVWAPDFRFIWSPRNFDVVRRGGELGLGLWPARRLRLDATATYAAVTYDTPGGAQVLYRPRVTYDVALGWTPDPWALDLRWHRIGSRHPNSAGTNPRPPISLLDLGLERRVGDFLLARAEVRDLADARAEFIAGHPTPGRTFTLTFTFAIP